MINNRGFSLIEILTGIGIGAVVVSIAAVIFAYAMEVHVNIVTKKALRYIRSEVYTNLNRKSVIHEILKSPKNQGSLSCYTSKTECDNIWKPIDFEIPVIDDLGKKVSLTSLPYVKKIESKSSPSHGKEGFDSTGANCNEFGTPQGSTSCPFQVALEWKPLCSGTSCTNAGIELRARMNISTKQKRLKAFNLQNLSSSVYVPDGESLNCEVQNYYFNPMLSSDGDGTACNSFYEKVTSGSARSYPVSSFGTNKNGSIYLIGIYEATSETHDTSFRKMYGKNILVNITDRHSPKSLTIILSSYEPVIWELVGNTQAVRDIYLFSHYCTDVVAPGVSTSNIHTSSVDRGGGGVAPIKDEISLQKFLEKSKCNADLANAQFVYQSAVVNHSFLID